MKYSPIANKSIYIFDTPFLSGFTTRKGGVSKGNFSSFNFYYGRGDTVENVEKNFEILRNKLNFYGPMLFPNQIHGDKIYFLKNKLRKKINVVNGYDGIITNVKGVLCGVKFADCMPILIYGKEYVAIIHSGWRGTLLNILGQAIEQLKANGEKVQDIQVIVGPHINEEHYEIKEDVLNKFLNKKYSSFIYKKIGNKIYLNLDRILMEQLLQYNFIRYYNVKLDTYSNKNLFYSYRRDGYNCGEMIMFFIL